MISRWLGENFSDNFPWIEAKTGPCLASIDITLKLLLTRQETAGILLVVEIIECRAINTSQFLKYLY